MHFTSTHKNRFSEPRFSEILDLMNKLGFSEQKESDNHIH